jgi:hypothetical protein
MVPKIHPSAACGLLLAMNAKWWGNAVATYFAKKVRKVKGKCAGDEDAWR